MKISDLTPKEQTNATTALRFLRSRCGGWSGLSKVLRISYSHITKVGTGQQPPSAAMVFRIARLAEVGVDDVLTGRYPDPNACPHCGHVAAQ